LYEVVKFSENLRKLEALIYETKYNIHVISKYMTLNKKNIETLDAFRSLRDESVKLLITERYLSLNEEILSIIYSYFKDLKDFNNMFDSIRFGNTKFILKKRFRNPTVGRKALQEMYSKFHIFYRLLLAFKEDLIEKNVEKIEYH